MSEKSTDFPTCADVCGKNILILNIFMNQMIFYGTKCLLFLDVHDNNMNMNVQIPNCVKTISSFSFSMFFLRKIIIIGDAHLNYSNRKIEILFIL